MYYKALAIESCWKELLEAAAAPPGTGFQISMRNEQGFRFTKTSDPLVNDQPPMQKTLFDPNRP